MTLFQTASNSAIISDCGLYRYALERDLLVGAGCVLFVMLNPSTADGLLDDNTIRRCRGFAMRWGIRHLLVANLYAYRATQPLRLMRVADPIGPEWETHTTALAERAQLRVAAWGTFPPPQRQKDVYEFLRKYGPIWCLGVTHNGSPCHPLYMEADAQLRPWEPR